METHKNILRAFAGESMARNKYTFFAKRAKAEGFEGIARIFEETAENEKAHASRLIKLLETDETSSLENYPLHPIKSTLENLKAAAEGEHYEWTQMYPSFEKTARDEKLDKIADVFKEIAKVEEEHEKRYQILLKKVQNSTVFKSETPIRWKCLNCGYIHEGTTPPDKCPACDHPQAFFEPWCQSY